MSKTKLALTGIVVSLNTPFDSNGRIDFESLNRLIDYHLQSGAAGFLSPAQAGEVGTLSLADRRELVAFIQNRVDGRAFYVAGATAEYERDSFLAAESAVTAGCQAVLVEAPAALRTDRAGITRFFREFAGVGMELLMIQDLDWRGPGLDIETIRQLFEEIDSFRSLKVEVSPAGPKNTRIIEATSGNLHVCGGWAAEQMIEALDRGVDVFIPTAITALYREIFYATVVATARPPLPFCGKSYRCWRSLISTWIYPFSSTSGCFWRSASSPRPTSANPASRTTLSTKLMDKN